MGRYALEGIRVANFGWSWAGPAAGHYLADMGAEVIKIETMRRVDITRSHGGYFKGVEYQSYYAHNIDRSMLSLTLDLQHPEGAALARSLVAQSDMVIENFRPGVMRRLGLDYVSLAKARPDVIMLSMSTGGQTGPLANITAYGGGASCLSGLLSLQGYDDGFPMPFGTTYFDPFNAAFGDYALLAALHHRDETGLGQHIDLSQAETATSLLGDAFMDYALNGRVQSAIGNRDLAMAPHNVYRCAGDDDWVAIAVETDEEWRALCDAVGPSDGVERSWDGFQRLRRQPGIDAWIGRWTLQRSPSDAAEALQQAGVPAFPCLRDSQVFTDPHFTARGDWVPVQHHLGREVLYGVQWKLSETPGEIRRPCPDIGQDNDFVLRDILGLDERELARLYENKAIC